MEKFHIRFGIEVGEEDARRRFVNRAINEIFSKFFFDLRESHNIQRHILTRLGESDWINQSLVDYHLKNDFFKYLQAIEAIYEALKPSLTNLVHGKREELDQIVNNLLALSEVDLSIRWENGRFLPSRAEFLDKALVDDPLRWLRLKPEYKTVITPFEKSLRHLLQAKNRPELYQDVIRDAYEALEALGIIITGRPDKDLSANRDLIIKKLGLGEKHKRLLKEYINYANEYRHAVDQPRTAIGVNEAESFVYLTGWFIRLAVEQPLEVK
jgi:hypothetical protein